MAINSNPNRIAGIAYLFVDGVNYMLSGDLEYSCATVERETLSGQDRVHGFSEKPKAPFIAMTIRDSGGLDVAALNAMDNVTVTANLNNGKTVMGRNMWTVQDQTVKTADGTIETRFEGLDVVEC